MKKALKYLLALGVCTLSCGIARAQTDGYTQYTNTFNWQVWNGVCSGYTDYGNGAYKIWCCWQDQRTEMRWADWPDQNTYNQFQADVSFDAETENTCIHQIKSNTGGEVIYIQVTTPGTMRNDNGSVFLTGMANVPFRLNSLFNPVNGDGRAYINGSLKVIRNYPTTDRAWYFKNGCYNNGIPTNYVSTDYYTNITSWYYANTNAPFPPTNLTAVAGDSQVALSWPASSGATSYNVKRSTTAGGPYAIIANPSGTSDTDTGLANGTTYYYVVTALDSSGESADSIQVGATPYTSTLPTGWSDQDIGNPSISGSAGYANGTFTVAGSGADIWGTSDQFNYAYEAVSGDQTIVARAVSENGTASYAKAGVMIRETTAANAVEASVLLTPANGIAMEIRPTTGSSSINMTGWIAGIVPPQWVKLVRSGSTFTGYYSADGSTWTQIASTNLTMAASALAGLAVTSHDTASLNTATFDNVSISGTQAQPPAAPAGLTAAAGNAQVALSWTASSGATSYNVKRATVSGGPYTTIANVTSTGYTDTSVVNGTTYYYVVSAVNSAGESPNSGEVSATPQAATAPAAPTNLTASGAKRKISLTWTQSTSPNIANNNVYRSAASGGPYTLLTTLSATTSYTDTGIKSGTTYYYVVTAVNSSNLESPYSNEAGGTAR
ncbi:MAG: DUF1349 domain-containing protein [Verrucomicrobia bacterium]|nr:DUF1349 domain-containing protein [Verrucomicrobiota bacterium]MDE3099783.1 DUF1349 domain-containing protein [Verrucomicrobiota bacterium]